MTTVGPAPVATTIDRPSSTVGARVLAWLRGPGLREWLWALPLYVVLLFVLQYFIDVAWASPPYSNDSWTFVELSHDVFSDPGGIRTFRLFDSTEPYTTVLLGWPVIIHLVDMVTGTNYHAPLQAAALCMIVAALCLDQAGKRWFGRRGFGPGVILLLFLFNFFHNLLISASPLAPAVMWLAVIIWLVSAPWPLSNRRVVVVGLASAAFVHTRVESATLVIAIALVVWLVGGMHRRQLWRFGAGLLAGLLPWIVYSLVHFGRPFVTPYSSSALAAEPTTPVDYWPNPPPSLFQAPGQFFSRFPDGWPIMWNRLALSIDAAIVLRWLVAVVAVALVASIVNRAVHADGDGAWSRARQGLGGAFGHVWANPGVKVLVPVAALSFPLNAFFELLGYAFDPRYWSLCIFLAEAALVAVLLSFDLRRALVHIPLRIVATATVCVLGLLPVAEQRAMTDLWPLNFYTGFAIPTDQVLDVAACVNPNERILFAEQSGMPYIYGALTNGTSAAEPLNFARLTVTERQQFLEDFRIEWIVFGEPTPERMQGLVPAYEAALGKRLAPSPCRLGLYYIHDLDEG